MAAGKVAEKYMTAQVENLDKKFEDAYKAAGVKLGDASVAEEIAAQDRATAEVADIKRFHDIQTYYTGSMRTVAQGQTASDDFADYTGEYAAEQELAAKIRAQKLEELLQNTLQNQQLRPDAELSKPIVMANSTKQGDNINQTQISAGELSTDHSDAVAKHLSTVTNYP